MTRYPNVTIVSGPPLAGKTSYVHEHGAPADLVVDWDAIAVALGSPVSHGHARTLWPYIAAARDAVYRRIQRGHDGHVWIITSNPRTAGDWPGCRHIRLDIDRAEAHRRADEAGRPASYHINIDDWYDGRQGRQASARSVNCRPGCNCKRLAGRARQERNARILRASDVCHICGQPGADAVDHVIPWAISHDDSMSNLAPAHHDVEPRCNRHKSDKLVAPGVRRSGALS